jgi:hypothetical protein
MATLLQEEATAGGHQPDETAQQQRRQPATTGVPLPREVTFTGDAPQGWPTSRGYLGPVLFFLTASIDQNFRSLNLATRFGPGVGGVFFVCCFLCAVFCVLFFVCCFIQRGREKSGKEAYLRISSSSKY